MKRTLSLVIFLSGLCLAQANNGYDENFNSGLSNWVITSQGSSCTWENYYPPYPGPYSIPGAEDGILAADADQCGTAVNTTAMLDTLIDMSGYFCVIFLSWGNDWNATDGNDSAFVEISTDFGDTWEVMWEKDGVSARTSTETAYFDEYVEGDFDYALLRLRTVQNGSGSWWAIDNFDAQVSYVLEMPATPTSLTAQLSGQDVLLNWEFTATPSWELGFQITRKEGGAWPYNNYVIVDSVDVSERSYLDTTVHDNTEYSYRIRAYSFQLYSLFSDAAFIATPVELTGFSAAVNGGDIILNWSTASETNNRGFIIERNAGEGFKGIGFTPGSGTTALPRSYTFTDKNPPPGTYSYRLKQVDYNGSYEYSGTAEADLRSPVEFTLAQNYPNPFNPSTRIEWETPAAGRQVLKIFDVLGKEIVVLVNEYRPAGNYVIDFAPKDLPGGVYIYQLISGTSVQARKMILLK